MTTHKDVEKLTARVEQLAVEVARLGSDLSDVMALVEVPADAEEGQGLVSTAVAPAYESLDHWVEQYFLVVFARSTGGELRWCLEWRQHPEAVTRLEALWRSWEAMRMDTNLGIASWLVSYLDPILSVLLARQGTFASCSPKRHGTAAGSHPPNSAG